MKFKMPIEEISREFGAFKSIIIIMPYENKFDSDVSNDEVTILPLLTKK